MDDLTSEHICEYVSPDGVNCRRQAVILHKCPFHTPINEDGGPDDRGSDSLVLTQLHELIANSDGNWVGFIFPKKIKFSKEVFSLPIGFAIDARYSSFFEVIFDDVEFKENIVFDNSSFEGDFTLGRAKFEKGLSLIRCKFSGKTSLNNIRVKSELSCYSSEFKSSFKISGVLQGAANFNETVFEGAAIFQDARNVSLSVGGVASLGFSGMDASFSVQNSSTKSAVEILREKMVALYVLLLKGLKMVRKKIGDCIYSIADGVKRRYRSIRRNFPHRDDSVSVDVLFYGEAHFEGVTFRDAKSTLFKGVDLRRARFLRTDVRDVKFIGNNWYQKSLGRNGLYDEVWLNSCDYNTKRNLLSALEYTYRYIRLSMENVKDYTSANDFYVGEMDAARRQLKFFMSKFFSISAIYNLLSRYGTSPVRITLWMVALICAHSFLVGKYFVPELYERVSGYEFVGLAQVDKLSLQIGLENFYFVTKNFLDLMLYSLQVMTLQKTNAIFDTGNYGFVKRVNVFFSLLGPIFLAMFVLAFRARMKRH